MANTTKKVSMNLPEVPTYVASDVVDYKIELVEWHDGKEHETDVRKIKISFNLKAPSEEELKEGQHIYKPTGELCFGMKKENNDFSQFVEAFSNNKDDEVLTAIMDIDEDIFVPEEDEDVVTNILYLENREFAIIITTKTGDLLNVWKMQRDEMEQIISDIYDLNSKIELGLL